jgi:pimeloyl-ACP methyl ester carboxylesterase
VFRHKDIQSGELRLHCLLTGADDAPTVLLVHGSGGHAHWWDVLVPFFVPGYRLIAPDLRGHGESSWPTEPAYGIADLGSDLLAVVDTLGRGPLAVVAHSMGARAAAWFAATYPDRVHALALLDTSIAGVDAETARRWRGRVAGQRLGRVYPCYDEAIAAFRLVPPEANVPAAIAAPLAHHAVVERRPGEWTFRFDRAVLSLDGDGGGDLTDVVATLRCPLWIGRGRRSGVSPPRELDIIRAAHPRVEVHEFAGGHHFFLADPAPAGAALRDFLDRTAADAR